ncbi:MAG TPA: His-Xaa-Ser system radical SAM maturase HxsB [Candidatus Lokiarchaeia archaeon]
MIKQFDSFSSFKSTFYLLPFRFHRFKTEKELIVNDFGDFLIIPKNTVNKIVNRKIIRSDNIYNDLISKFFISEKKTPEYLEILATRYRTKKSFLFNFTSLHIIVPTLRCNQNCRYCQASHKESNRKGYDLKPIQIDLIIELIFKSPSPYLTIEFQGGEPLLVFDLIKQIVIKCLKKNANKFKEIRFVICTNLISLTEKHLIFLKKYNIFISTSLDGPEFIHNKHRIYRDENSYQITTKNILKCKQILGNDRVSALMTTSKYSLRYPKEIINEYLNQGFKNIFFRPINPFGLSIQNNNFNYTIDEFLVFYKAALNYIIELNKSGIYFVEELATIFLTKILTPFHGGFTDIQSPSGAINSVVVYNYDGYVYASDEARMMAETGNCFFRLGSIEKSTYEEIFYGFKAHEIIQSGLNEILPSCSECAFQTYCGSDPVRNYHTQGDMIGKRPNNDFCRKNRIIIEYLFELMENDLMIKRIFYSWVNHLNL